MADVTLPQLGETVTEGTITQWFKNVGDTVAADEPLFEVSTDKVDTEVPSPVSGVLTEIRVPEGDTVDVGTVIAVVGDSDAAPAAAPAAPTRPKRQPPRRSASRRTERPRPPRPQRRPRPRRARATGRPPPRLRPRRPPPPAPAAPAAAAPPRSACRPLPRRAAARGDNRLLSPVVRRLVNEHGLDPDAITGTGPGGRITRDDVLDHIDATGATPRQPRRRPLLRHRRAAAPAAAPAAAAPAPAPGARCRAGTRTAAAPAATAGERDTSVPLSKIRTLTGNHMVMSKATSPHAFSVVEVDFANVDVVRNKVKAEWKSTHGFSLTYLPFISRAIIDGLREFPHLNASVGERDLIVHNFVDLGIAVDLDYEGLLAPVIRDAETKRLAALASEISDLANRARTRKLSPDEISGGTFTISNNGSAGSVLTMPIINQPQVAIISTDAIVRKPVVTVGARRRRGHRHPPGRQPGHELGPPGLRRRLRRRLPQAGQGDPRDQGLVDRTVTIVSASRRARETIEVGREPGWHGRADCRLAAAGPLARSRAVPRGARAADRRCSSTGREQHLLLLEHPHVFTHGTRADLEHNLQCEPAAVGAELVPVKRGGDITYHGPGQLVGYPILNVDNRLGAAGHVCGVEGLIIDALARARPAERRPARRVRRRVARRRSSRSAVVPRKIAAIGVRLRNGRTMHGFALNVTTDMTYMREHIVPCGIGDRPVTSLAEEGIDVSMADVVDVVARLAAERWADGDDRTTGRRVAAPGRRPRPVGVLPRRRPGRRTVPVRCAEPRRGPARAGRGHRRADDRHAQARMAAPEGAARPGGDWRSRRRCANSAWSPCARTPVARTCPSAGPTARRRSWCSASAAPGRAGSASSTPAIRSPPAPTSRRASPRRSTGWASTTPC